ncbi:MAG: amidohydrolase family protein [Candidatus Geothermincolia bacterium]
MATRLPGLDDPEGDRVPDLLPPVVDAHVHVFPDSLMKAVRRWFDEHGYPVRYRLTSPELIAFLLERGVENLVLLTYAHKPGIAGGLNRYVAGLCAAEKRAVGLGTVFPGEPGVRELLREAASLGLRGIKVHQHVQCFDPAAAEIRAVCAACSDLGLPLVAHLGREPRSPAYRCDPHILCGAEKTRRLLEDFPGLTLVVPHLGSDEYEAYARLMDRHDNLWLDTTMMLGGFFPVIEPPPLTRYRADRILYGSDFCNLPHAWDRELKRIAAMDLDAGRLELLLTSNARRLFGIRGPEIGNGRS